MPLRQADQLVTSLMRSRLLLLTHSTSTTAAIVIRVASHKAETLLTGLPKVRPTQNSLTIRWPVLRCWWRLWFALNIWKRKSSTLGIMLTLWGWRWKTNKLKPLWLSIKHQQKKAEQNPLNKRAKVRITPVVFIACLWIKSLIFNLKANPPNKISV